MTQQTWIAVLAPIGIAGSTGQIIDPECVITVRDGAPLFAPNGSLVGLVTGASVVDGYLTVTGTLYPDRDIPNALPTFDSVFAPLHSDDPDVGTFTFHTLTVNAVRTGFEPAWSDSKIMFARNWCVHVLGSDDLIPMPDYATADRAATRFNRWWQNYLTRRRQQEGVYLPDTSATVRPWPYDADDPNGHARALAELREDDPDEWLS